MEQMRERWMGMLLCLLIAVPCWVLGKFFPVVGGPVFAILCGMLIALFYKNKQKTQAGITYTSKKILQFAVILLGFGMNLFQVAQVGMQSLPIILSTITTALLTAFLLYKLMKMPQNISTLIGVGSCICGGSAIAATAPVISADDEEIAQAISVIFLSNVFAALIFPTIGGWLGLSNEGFGLFAGTAINDTSSVTAAATAWDEMHAGANALDIATVVKLTRTLAIIPITLVLAVIQGRKSAQDNKEGEKRFDLKKIFPFFILFFVLASLLTTISVAAGVDATVFSPFKELSKFLIVMAMVAIGLNTNLIKLIKTGGKPIFMGLCCWVAISCVSLLVQYYLHII